MGVQNTAREGIADWVVHMTCDYCHGPLPEDARRGQRFCRDKCRSAWHRANSLPGQVTGVRMLKRGGWAVTIRYTDQPGVQIGSAVRLEMDDSRRPDAYSEAGNA